jgi:hypothetical protein
MRFHEAVAAMAKGECVKSQWGAIYKYDSVNGTSGWISKKWMGYGFATHETFGDWEIVPDPSVKPLDFFGAMEALKAGKAVRSCDGTTYWILGGVKMMMPKGCKSAKPIWSFLPSDVDGEWNIMLVPEIV